MKLRIAVTVLLCLSAMVLTTSANASRKTTKPDTVGTKVRAIDVRARPIKHFHKDGAERTWIGKLKWRGGLVLSSKDPAFGGYSGIELSRNGKRFVAVSDAGTWLTGEIAYLNGRPAQVKGARIGAVKALRNRDLVRRRDRDAEAIRLLKGTLQQGEALVSFEVNQRIGFFPIVNGRLAPPRRYLRPGQRLKANKGLEAIALLTGKQRKTPDLIAFAERSLDANGHHRGWIWQRLSGQARPVALTNDGGFDVTDAVSVGNGDLLVLERRFRWSEGVKMRIRRVPASRVKPGAVLYGTTLVRADLRYEIDNMEGISVHTDGRGRQVITLISDNNFNTFLQRTVLLQFELAK